MSGVYDLSVVIRGRSMSDIARFVSENYRHLILLFQPLPTLF